jgi:AcrR family transcriptional regulator
MPNHTSPGADSAAAATAPASPKRGAGQQSATAIKLLKAAGELMIERDTIDISLSELAKRSGINAALVKYHFGNKNGLLLALLTRDARSQIAKLDTLMQQPLSPTEKLRLHVAGVINAYYRYPYLNRLIHLLLYESSREAANEVGDFFVKPVFAFQQQLLSDGIASGEFRDVDPVLFFTSLMGAGARLFDGREVMSRALGIGGVTDDVRRRYVQHMTELFCGGILQPARSRKDSRTEKRRPASVTRSIGRTS